ncbi:copper chaperone PCu(A)C [Tranquillimonas alkanivorans]|uniref:Copper(I)-binding protein n=1 Tax=Tranquillimonas alkanivorans TaxID=441119 RepID=A0A1I5TN14_9RHOB|nr:copper chaperone PCu(A)C [Tranquillimonas alkanivorans]SFP84271.1 hypothetical protein SAMN04488047_11432 [Tranquillimonas alkanivorans]
MIRPLLIAALLTASPALAEVSVAAPWARASIIAARPGAAYLRLATTEADRLLSVTTPIADRVMIHAVEAGDDGVARMRPLDALDLQPDVPVTLEPGGMHIMLMGLTERLVEGTSFPLTLTFEMAGEVVVDVPVLGIAATGPGDDAR